MTLQVFALILQLMYLYCKLFTLCIKAPSALKSKPSVRVKVLHKECTGWNSLGKPKMNPSQNMSHQAGQAMGQAKEKAGNVMDSANNAAQSAKESCQEAGQQMQAKAEGAADAVKSTVGAHK
ncbi:hypothetical protein E2542_SST07836 [Spatholobus suberectus]|nr:hypothetical protein E2542_SST07836 [Spatholobus suberectus]